MLRFLEVINFFFFFLTSEYFPLNPFETTDFLKVRAQCENNSHLAYLKVSTVLKLLSKATTCENPALILACD